MMPGASLQFTETMSGFATQRAASFQGGYEQGKSAGTTISMTVTVWIDDVAQFINDPIHEASLSGRLWYEPLGGDLAVVSGTFNLLVISAGDLNRRRMDYRLVLANAEGEEFTATGFKDVHDDFGPDSWSDTTTLFLNVFEGRVEAGEEPNATLRATGIMRIGLAAFLRQLASFSVEAPTAVARAEALGTFGRFFMGGLWEVYGPGHSHRRPGPRQREVPLFTTEGVQGAEVTTHPITTSDRLGLSLLRFKRVPCRDVVMIVHGLTTSSDMFIMPEHYNLVSYLLDQGLGDVWTLDYRMSNRHVYNQQRHRYNMDEVALFDYPPAIARIREVAGPDCRIHVICHCLGAVSFLMSLFGGAARGITSVVANSVGLTPRVPGWSRVKLQIAPFAVEYILNQPYLNPGWSSDPGVTVAKVVARMVSLFHRECDEPSCHMLSLMWGTGWPALYNHANLLGVTHRRGADLYGATGMHYYRHVRRMVSHGNTAVKFDPSDQRLRSLPDNYFDRVAQVTTPVLLLTGQDNRVFTDSNIECFRRFEAIVPGRHRLRVIPGYGHQDVFMGKDVARDVFPGIVEFLNLHRS